MELVSYLVLSSSLFLPNVTVNHTVTWWPSKYVIILVMTIYSYIRRIHFNSLVDDQLDEMRIMLVLLWRVVTYWLVQRTPHLENLNPLAVILKIGQFHSLCIALVHSTLP